MTSIFNMFGQSPIKPLEQHIHKAYHCAKLLLSFFEAALILDWSKAVEVQKSISDMEQEADIIKRDLRLQLPSGLFLPVSRTDLLELLSAQDRIANKAQDIANLVVLRQMAIPKSLQVSLMELLTQCLETTKQACKAINELDELLETGFRGKEVDIVQDMILKLYKLEQESDEKLTNICKSIFELESKMSPIDVIFLYKLVQWIGDLADYAQTVGSRLHILIAR